MKPDKLDNEISELTIKLNKALVELEKEGNGFIEKSKLDKVFSLNKQLKEKIQIKNLQQ